MPKFGLCSDSNGTPHYVTEAQTYLSIITSALGFQPANYSVSGFTAAQIKAKVGQAITENCDTIMIVAGTNNFSQNLTGNVYTVVNQIMTDVSDAVAMVKAAGRKCIVGSPILPSDITQVYRHLELARRLELMCAREGVPYIPITERMLTWLDGRALVADVQVNVYTTEGWHGLASWHAFVAGLVIERQLAIKADPVVLFDLRTVGANGSTSFSDLSDFMRTVTAIGNTNIQNDAAVFDGTGDALTVPDSNDLCFGAKDFSISVTAKVNNANAVFLIQRQAAGDYFIFDLNSGKIRCQALAGSSIHFNCQVDFVPTVGTEYQIRVERRAGVVRFFVNGSLVGPAILNAFSIPNYAAPLSIGAGDILPAGSGFNGSISGLTITVG